MHNKNLVDFGTSLRLELIIFSPLFYDISLVYCLLLCLTKANTLLKNIPERILMTLNHPFDFVLNKINK